MDELNYRNWNCFWHYSRGMFPKCWLLWKTTVTSLPKCLPVQRTPSCRHKWVKINSFIKRKMLGNKGSTLSNSRQPCGHSAPCRIEPQINYLAADSIQIHCCIQGALWIHDKLFLPIFVTIVYILLVIRIPSHWSGPHCSGQCTKTIKGPSLPQRAFQGILYISSWCQRYNKMGSPLRYKQISNSPKVQGSGKGWEQSRWIITQWKVKESTC